MKKVYFLIFVLIFIFFIRTVYADQISFGSVGHNQRFTMIPGETKELKFSFFNYGNNPLIVEVKKIGSAEIRASISPKYFVLEDTENIINPMEEEEWVVLGNSYVKAVPVHVTLKVPDNISELSSNYHIVKIVATATTEETGSTGTKEKISQAREYSFAITVPGNIKAETWEEYNESLEEFYQEIESNRSEGSSSGKIGVKDTEEETEESPKGQLPTGFFSIGGKESFPYYIIIIIAAIIILVFLYRKIRR